MTTKQKAVMYTDAGYLHQFSAGGWGIHGYVYDDVVAKAGTGCHKAILTPDGYKPNSEKSKYSNLNIVNYVDGIGGMYDANSSTHTELYATKQALDHAATKDWVKLTIFTDSMNVIDGLTKHARRWQAEGWKKPDGTPRPNAKLWESALRSYDNVRSKLDVSLEWVKGHAGDFGNEMVDAYARRGNAVVMNATDYTWIQETPSKGYWSPKVEFNRMLANSRWYYSTLDLNQTTECGKTIYHLGSHGKEDFDYGKATGDHSMTVLFLNEPDPVLEIIRKRSYDMDTNRVGHVMIARLDMILTPSAYKEILDHDGKFLLNANSLPGNNRIDILQYDKSPVVRQQTPPGLTFLACQKLNGLEARLVEYLEGSIHIQVTDITDKIFTKEEKGKAKRIVTIIHPDFTQSTKYMDLDVKYCLLTGADIKDVDKRTAATKTHKVRMLVNGDLPRRNVFSNLVDANPKVYVITWLESEHAFRYATVVVTDDGVGIWANIDSNLQLVSTGG